MHGFEGAWLPPRDWNKWTDANTVMVDVKFSWDNGFGDRVFGQYGGVYLPRWQYEVGSGGTRAADSISLTVGL